LVVLEELFLYDEPVLCGHKVKQELSQQLVSCAGTVNKPGMSVNIINGADFADRDFPSIILVQSGESFLHNVEASIIQGLSQTMDELSKADRTILINIVVLDKRLNVNDFREQAIKH
jgi:hypothetical protein